MLQAAVERHRLTRLVGERRRQMIASLEAEAKAAKSSPGTSDESEETRSPQTSLDSLQGDMIDLDGFVSATSTDGAFTGRSLDALCDVASLEQDNLLSFSDMALADMSQPSFDFNGTMNSLNFFTDSTSC
jgi:hypothetical protein